MSQNGANNVRGLFAVVDDKRLVSSLAAVVLVASLALWVLG